MDKKRLVTLSVTENKSQACFFFFLKNFLNLDLLTSKQYVYFRDQSAYSMFHAATLRQKLLTKQPQYTDNEKRSCRA